MGVDTLENGCSFITVYLDLQKAINYLLIALTVSSGVVTGMLSARVLGLSFGSEPIVQSRPDLRETTVQQLSEEDFQIILDRNLFDSKAVGQAAQQIDFSNKPLSDMTLSTPRPTEDLTLIGTVVAGEKSLAVIQVGREVDIFRVNDKIAPGIELVEVKRQLVVIREGGQTRELLLLEAPKTQPRSTQSTQPRVSRNGEGEPSGIVDVGENRWKISKAMADNARSNLNELLKSARMIPQVQDGETIGFKVVQLTRGSLLEQIGLKVGDLVVEINNVELNSPEKALQIFQQVREADNIKVGLVRNGQREVFEYDLE